MTNEQTTAAPLVAIVGRPNVGKSALFNRVVGRRTALVEDLPGTTRDRLYGEGEWRGRTLRVVDTGGLEAESEGPFSPLVRRQIEQAIDEADLLLFVVDARDGLTAADLEIAEMLRRVTKPLLLIANKADNPARAQEVHQFYELGLGEPLPVSAYHGAGVADMMDAVLDLLPEVEHTTEERTSLRVAIVGRPNVGKSALMNAILGEERVIVSDIPGTTRDVIDTEIAYGGQPITLLDTAGIRRRGRIERGVERHSVQRAQTAIERADVALVLMDAGELGAAQDTHIMGMAEDAHVGVILVVNKMDLLPPGEEARDEVRRLLRARARFIPWAPILFVSAKEKRGLNKLLDAVLAVGEQRQRRVPTGELNQFVRRAITTHQPPSVNGRRLKVLYITQAEVQPPTFVFFVNDAALLHFGYQRYLENKIREAFGFEGTAVRLIFKSRGEEDVEPLRGGRAAR
ncbi:MAG: ribosome biogenesis GTPase Der [Dehalococcoidia bacterium]